MKHSNRSRDEEAIERSDKAKIRKFYQILIFTLIVNVNAKNVKIHEEKTINKEVEEIFDDFSLLKNTNSNAQKTWLRNVKKAPFIWPVCEKNIKKITFYTKNQVRIDLVKRDDIITPHKGIIIGKGKNSIEIKHIVNGGICYVISIKNVEGICVNAGDIVADGAKIGESESIIMEIFQDDVSVLPNIGLLFPTLDAKRIEIAMKIA